MLDHRKSKGMSIILQARFNSIRTENFHMYKLNLEKAEEPEIKLSTFFGSSKKHKSSRETSICFTDYAKAFDCVDHNKLWKLLKEMGIPDHLTYLLRNLYASQEAAVRTDIEQSSSVQSLSHVRLFATP